MLSPSPLLHNVHSNKTCNSSQTTIKTTLGNKARPFVSTSCENLGERKLGIHFGELICRSRFNPQFYSPSARRRINH